MLPAIYDRYITDPAKETAGVVKDFGEFVVTIARSGGANEAFGIELAKAFKPYQQIMALDEMPDDKTRELYYDITARVTVKHWSFKVKDPTDSKKTLLVDGLGYADDGTGIIAASYDNLVALFKTAPELWVDIKMFAERRENYQAESRAVAAKNSAPSLPTS